MKRVTNEDIQNFIKLFNSLGSYAKVAEETGFSASTVSKYIKMSNQGDNKAKKEQADFIENSFNEPIKDIVEVLLKVQISNLVNWLSMRQEEKDFLKNNFFERVKNEICNERRDQ
jgi:predicted transcriptional regulator